MSGSTPPASQSPRPGGPPNAYPYQGQRPPMYPGKLVGPIPKLSNTLRGRRGLS